MLFAHLITLALHAPATHAVSPTCVSERSVAVESCEKRLLLVKNADAGQFPGGNDFVNTDLYAAKNKVMAGKIADAMANCEDSRTWFDKKCTEALHQPGAREQAIELQRRKGIEELNKLITAASKLQADYAGRAFGATAQNDSRGDADRATARAGVQPPHVFQRMETSSAEDE